MRKSVLWNGFHVRLSLAVGVALLVSLAIAGCGGGGSSSGGGGGTTNSNLATVTGTVQDSSGNAVTGATVSIVGTSLAASTGSTGTFTIKSVPLNAGSFQVTSPSVASYYNVGTYNGVQYTFGTSTSSCSVPLPALSAGKVTSLSTIVLDVNGGSAPPPPPLTSPPAGCPNP